jgi:hypothetical protein
MRGKLIIRTKIVASYKMLREVKKVRYLRWKIVQFRKLESI